MNRQDLLTRLSALLLLIGIIFIPVQTFVSGNNEATDQPIVYYIPVEQTVERGLEAFMKRSFEVAQEEGADHIVLEIDTPGGAVDAAGKIGALLRNSEIPVTAFVTVEAISAGAFIALNADQIVMAPSTTMGSAAVIDGAGNAADEKAQSYWLANMREAANLNGRDPVYALAMADKSIDLPEYGAPEGELLTLGPDQALEVGYAEAIAHDRAELLQFLELEHAVEREMKVSASERIARFVTHPVVIPILLSVGSLGLVLELYSPGFGIPGIMGASALLLFFFGHLIAGFAGWESLILMIVGLLLIGIEVFVVGFGIFAILGIVAIVVGMMLASFSTSLMLISLAIAFVITAVALVVLFVFLVTAVPGRSLY